MNAHTTGKAYLVGAGPGHPELITVRGLKLIQQADVILYDRLIPQELLAEARPGAELIFAGKGPRHAVLGQDATTALLIQKVCQGLQVVRLKGGDPFVFGRGGEEALALAAAGLPFEVVPGISSAIAGPGAAGIPVTHRGLSTAFAVVTGHVAPDGVYSVDGANVLTPWDALAKMPTLVLLMGVRHLDKVCAALIAAGRSPATPAAAISWAATEHQKVARASLAGLPEAARAARLAIPVVSIIGEVVSVGDHLPDLLLGGPAAGFIPLPDEDD